MFKTIIARIVALFVPSDEVLAGNIRLHARDESAYWQDAVDEWVKRTAYWASKGEHNKARSCRLRGLHASNKAATLRVRGK